MTKTTKVALAGIGAGFGGIAVAVELARLLPQSDNGEIVVVDEDNFLLFTPMLTEAAAGEINPRHVVVGVHEFSKRIRFIQGRIDHVNLQTREVTVTIGGSDLDPEQRKITADQLVIALGSVTNFHHVAGAAEHCLEVKRLGDADAICKRALASIDRALIESDPAKRKALLTFIVAGGGYTGVETIAAVNDLVRAKCAEYGLDAGEVRTVLVNPGDRLLTETSAELAEYATEKLKQHGVDIRMNASARSVSADSVELDSGERVSSHTVIWAAGVKPNPMVESLGCEKGKHGGIKVNGCCQIESAPGVWALGDCAEIPQPNKTGIYAPTAQNATREGALVAKNIVAALRGEVAQPFTFKPLGELGHRREACRRSPDLRPKLLRIGRLGVVAHGLLGEDSRRGGEIQSNDGLDSRYVFRERACRARRRTDPSDSECRASSKRTSVS